MWKMENDQNRIVYIDNLRNMLVYLVVLLHATCVFTYPLTYYWSTIDKERSNRIYEIIGNLLDVFSMPHLMFLAAFFIFISLKDKTRFQYLKSRFKRLYVPVIVYVFCAGDIYFQLLSKRLTGNFPSYSDTFIGYWANFVNNFGITFEGKGKMLGQVFFCHRHLWFMSFLFLVTLVILAIPSRKKEKTNAEVEKKAKIMGKAIVFSTIMGFTYYIVFVVYGLVGIPSFSVISFFGLAYVRADQFWILLCYFLFGLYAYKKEWLTKGDIGSWKLWGMISVMVLIVFVALTYQLLPFVDATYKTVEHNLTFMDKQPLPKLPPSNILTAIIRIMLYPLLSMCLLMFFLSFLKKFFNKPNQITEFCSKHSINVYILHFILIIVLQHALADVVIPSALMVALYMFINLPACLWLSHRLVYPFPKMAILFFVLLKLVSLWAGFDFYYWALLTIILISFISANVEFVRYILQKSHALSTAE